MHLFLYYCGEESDENAKQERLDRISRMTEMEDLQAPHDHPLAPLCIKVELCIHGTMLLNYCHTGFLYVLFQNQDPRDYFDSQQLKTSDDTRAGSEQLRCSLSSEEAYGSLRGSISEIKAMGLSDPVVRPEVAVMVIASLFCASLKILDIILLITKNPEKVTCYHIYVA